mgnify:CR=1 FL=1
MFERLISVSGVGPKVAMAVLSSMQPDKLALSIIAGDEKEFSKVPGIGKKTAQRIILELKEKIDTQEAVAGAAVAAGLVNAEGAPQLSKAQGPVRLAVSGRSVGPPLWESLTVLGPERTLARLRDLRSRLD